MGNFYSLIPYMYKFLRDVIFKVFAINWLSAKFSYSKFHWRLWLAWIKEQNTWWSLKKLRKCWIYEIPESYIWLKNLYIYGNFFVCSPNEAVLKYNCLKGFLKFILIDHCVGELLSINKVSSEGERTIHTSLKLLLNWLNASCKLKLAFVHNVCIYYLFVLSLGC